MTNGDSRSAEKSNPWYTTPAVLISAAALLVSTFTFARSIYLDREKDRVNQRLALREMLVELVRETGVAITPFRGGDAPAAPAAPEAPAAPMADPSANHLPSGPGRANRERVALASLGFTVARNKTIQTQSRQPTINSVLYLEAARDLADRLDGSLSYVDHLILGLCATPIDFTAADAQLQKSLEALERKEKRTSRPDVFGRHIVLCARAKAQYQHAGIDQKATAKGGRQYYEQATSLLAEQRNPALIQFLLDSYQDWIDLESQLGENQITDCIRGKRDALTRKLERGTEKDASPEPAAPAPAAPSA